MTGKYVIDVKTVFEKESAIGAQGPDWLPTPGRSFLQQIAA